MKKRIRLSYIYISVRIVKTWPAALYCTKTWTVNKKNIERLLKCGFSGGGRNLQRIFCAETVTNEEVHRRVDEKRTSIHF